MSFFRQILASTIVRKAFLAVTGLGLFAFVVGHLAGNLLIFAGPEAFNSYSHTLISMGGLLYFVEFFLAAVFLIHVAFAILVTLKNRKSRPTKYRTFKSQGPPSRLTVSSKTMIWTGLVLLVFTVIHLETFKFGPDVAEGYVVSHNGEQVRDLHRLVMEVFSDPVYVAWYVAAMILLGVHLRHGFWSAFQSLGVFHPRYTPLIYGAGALFAILLAAGFLAIPVWVYLKGVVS